jgi:bacterioferritin (cytochrome b1)
MQGSESVIKALNNVLAHTLALHSQAHLQEHYWESTKYGFSGWFDKIETKAHTEMTHYLLNRIRSLGGRMVYAWAWEPTYDESIGPAMRGLLMSMSKTHAAYVSACNVAEKDDDYVTAKMIWCHLKHLEKWMTKFEARIAQLDALGEAMFLAEFI